MGRAAFCLASEGHRDGDVSVEGDGGSGMNPSVDSAVLKGRDAAQLGEHSVITRVELGNDSRSKANKRSVLSLVVGFDAGKYSSPSSGTTPKLLILYHTKYSHAMDYSMERWHISKGRNDHAVSTDRVCLSEY